jgi:hypothetical protein
MQNSGLNPGKVKFTKKNRAILNLITVWSGIWESNPSFHFGKVKLYRLTNPAIIYFIRVGDTGFEPATSWSQTMHASQLRQSPINQY